MTCRDCRYLDVALNAAGRRVPRKGNAYPCTAPVVPPPLPVSITKAYGWQWPPARRHMEPNEGQDCPTFAYFDYQILAPKTKAEKLR